MAGIYSQGGSAGHRYAGWLSEVEAKNFQFGGKVFNGSPSAIYVGSNLVWGSDWLTVAAQKAIRGAFGQRDGWAVIKATNAYLNQLAASDMDKATALAGFINEDPMLVCSLGLEVEGVTMPIRWLVGDGAAYINSGYKANQDSDIDFMFKLVTLPPSGGSGIAGSREAYNSKAIGTFDAPDGIIYADFYTSANRCSANSGIGIMNRVRINKDRVIVNEQTLTCQPTPSSWETIDNIFIFNYSGNGSPAWLRTDQAFAYYKDGNKREMYPFIRKVNNVATLGMIDVLHDVLYTNAGSGQFTEEFGYMQNGSWVTWTPSTP